MQAVSAAGLIVYVLTMTFASVDWLMSLEPHWYSTIFSIVVISGQGLSAVAVAIIVLAAVRATNEWLRLPCRLASMTWAT